MYARIIVGTDGSDRARRAVPVGSTAADAFACPLELVHVPADEDADDLDTADVQLLAAADPASGLVARATATDPPGLLCLSSRGRTALGELVFGSVSAEVIRSSRSPVLVVGPSSRPASRRWRRMLVCLDGSTNAEAIVPAAAAWARQLDLGLELLHVAYPLGDPRAGDLRVPEEERAAAAQLRAVAAELELAGVAVRPAVVEHTHLAEGIAERADDRLTDIIAIATHGRTGLARVVAGSVALEVVRRAPVPVLTLRPTHLH